MLYRLGTQLKRFDNAVWSLEVILCHKQWFFGHFSEVQNLQFFEYNNRYRLGYRVYPGLSKDIYIYDQRQRKGANVENVIFGNTHLKVQVHHTSHTNVENRFFGMI